MKSLTFHSRHLAVCVIALASLPTTARADFDLGEAVNYAVIAGPNTNSFQISNSTFNGNVATDYAGTTAKGNYVQFSSGTINGNFSFVGTAQTNLGSGKVTGSIISNDANVSSAYSTISSLSSKFAGESGTSFNGGGTLTATNGVKDTAGNYVFTTTAYQFLQNGTLTINGTSSQYVVINVTGNNNVQLKNLLSLTGGITDDHVFINILGNNQQIGGNTNGGIINGVIVALNDKYEIDHTTIDGRLIGGGFGQDCQMVSGLTVNEPTIPQTMPEPSGVIMMAFGCVMSAGFGLYRRRGVVKAA